MERIIENLRRTLAGARGWRREIVVALLLTVAAAACIVGAIVEGSTPSAIMSADKPPAH
jgi:hypothetical protein